ncbi:MAG: hypothetical protein ACKOV8_07140 [Phycisphaerales bacterium]
MSIDPIGVPARLMAVAAGSVAIASIAHGAVRTFTMNWTPSALTESVFVTIDNLNTGPTSSSSAVTGWDLQIESSNSGSVLKFNFPPFSGPVNPGNPNPYYGLMRLPGVTTGPGASISNGTIVQQVASYADSGPVTFGGGAGDWRLNSVNIFGFRFRSPSSGTTQAIHYGYGRIFVGATPGQFRLIELSYQETAGAALTVVPGPGALAVMAGAAILGRGRRRR